MLPASETEYCAKPHHHAMEAKPLLTKTVLILFAAVLFACGCRSYQPWDAGVAGAPVPPVVTDQTIVLPRENMVYCRISPAQYGQNQPDFFMLETEVANGMYSKYLLATGKMKNDYAVYDQHIADLVRDGQKRLKENRRGWNYPHYGTTGPLDSSLGDLMNRMILWDGQYPRCGQEALPVTLVTVHDAEDFCSWLTSCYPALGTFRLPTVDEWLLAAYGKDRNYPWGSEWQGDAFHHTRHPPPPADTNALGQWNADRFVEQSPEPVKWRPQGRTPEGLYGMWGNAEEMVVHPSNVVNAVFVFVGTRWMGGSFKDSSHGPDSYPFKPRADYWGFTHSDHTRDQALGFRVLLDPSDKEHRFQPRAPYNVGASW